MASLSDLFDVAAETYLVAVDAEDWLAVWELASIIDRVHGLAERQAA